MINQWFLSVIEVSLTTGIVILILKILSFLISRNYAAKWKKWVWLLVTVRLLLPISITWLGAPVQLHIPNQGNTYRISDTAAVNMKPEVSAKAVIGSIKADNDNTNYTGYPAADKGKHTNFNLAWLTVTALVWIIGMTVYLVYHLIGEVYYRKQILRWSRIAKEQGLHDQIKEISEQLGIKTPPVVFISNKTESPALIGLIHPLLLLPSDCYSDTELNYILRHELIHYQQKDIWYKLLLLLANAVHWFNPAVYLLRGEACRDLEFACDDEVTKSMSAKERIKYGEAILSCISRQKLRRMALATGFNDKGKTLKDRLKNISSERKKRNGLLIIIISLVLILSIGALFSLTRDNNMQEQRDGLTWYGAVSLLPENIELPDKLIENMDEWNEFIESDRTIALVVEIPLEDILVYGRKEPGEEKGTFTLRGIYVKRGKEAQVLDINWGVYGELPEIRYQDYDGDGIKEIAIISRGESGTGISLNDLYILKDNPEGGWTVNRFASIDWEEQLNKRMGYQLEDGLLTITLDGKDTGYRIDAAALEEEWGDTITSVFFGSLGRFQFYNGDIYLEVLPVASVGDWATPQNITDDYLSLKVVYNGGFELIYDAASGLVPSEEVEGSR